MGPAALPNAAGRAVALFSLALKAIVLKDNARSGNDAD
jgi:hypothetical protein